METQERWASRSVADALQSAAEQWPEHEAVVVDGDRITYRDLDERSHLVAGNLARFGLRPGDHLALCMGNSVEWVIQFFAASRMGATVVPISTRFTAPEIEYCLGQSDVRMLVTADRFRGMDFARSLREIAPDGIPHTGLPELATVIMTGECSIDGVLPYSELYATQPSEQAGHVNVAADDIAVLQFTSGTTSHPKGVLLSHESIGRNAWEASRRLGLQPGDRYHSARPLFHVAGITLSLLACVEAGATYITTARFDPESALRALETEGCTHISGNDTLFLMMLSDPSFEERTLSLRGGWAAASEGVLREVQQRMVPGGLCAAYGLAEASPNVAMSPFDDDLAKRLDGLARPLPGIEVQIRDAVTGNLMPPNEPGEIYVRGWGVMRGYYKMPVETSQAVDGHGWLRTGDLGYSDGDGRIAFVGRYKDTLKVGGENVAPAEIENVLVQHPAVSQARVVGVPDPRLVEVPAAYVILQGARSTSSDELIEWTRKRLASFRVPRHVRLIDSFDDIGMTPSGKIQRNKLREYALDDLELREHD